MFRIDHIYISTFLKWIKHDGKRHIKEVSRKYLIHATYMSESDVRTRNGLEGGDENNDKIKRKCASE